MPDSAHTENPSREESVGKRSVRASEDPPPRSPRLTISEFLRGTRIVTSRELEAYFDSPIAYITAAVFLVMAGTSFTNSFFLAGVIDMTPFFDTLPLLLIPFVPALTMRSWTEEHAQGTVEL